MVSKAVVFAGLMIAAVLTGVVVGLQLNGAGGSDTPAGTPTAAGASAATSTPPPTVAPSSFDEGAIETEILAAVNGERNSRGLARLETLDPLREMARFHSDNMADAGYVTHGAGGYDTAARYERFDLAERCKVVDDSGSSIRRGRELEVVEKTAGVRSGGDGRVARSEEAIARTLVDEWFADDTARQRLTMANAERVGVGVTVAASGDVYATLDLC